ncbi:MAG: flagellar hook-length control protein FliK [Gammaproteobacteria bacterium]
MADATTALSLVNSEIATAAAARDAASQTGTAQRVRIRSAGGRNDMNRADTRVDAPSPDAGDRQSFATTLETVDARAAPRPHSETGPPAAAGTAAAAGREGADDAPDPAVALPFSHLLIAAAPPPSGQISLSGENVPPAGGNELPSSPTAGATARSAAFHPAGMMPPTATGEAVTDPATTADKATLNEADGPLPGLVAAAPGASHPPHAIPGGPAARSDGAGNTARADPVRAAMPASPELTDTGAGASHAGGDAPTGDGSRQPHDGLLHFTGREHDASRPAPQVVAEFSLNTGPQVAVATDGPRADATLLGVGDTDVLSGRRPFQPLGDQAQWSQNLGQRLLMMSDGGVQTARLRLHPEHLGQLDVRIEIEDDSARVWFNAASGQTRDAIESALPKLREMFDARGLELLQADVFADSRQSDADREARPGWTGGTNPDGATAPAADRESVHAIIRRSDRLVDFYA